MWKKLAKDYFTFTKKERAAVTVLICIILSVWLIPYLIPPREDKFDEQAWHRFMEEAARLKPATNEGATPVHPRKYARGAPDDFTGNAGRWNRKPELFYFDPNTISAAEWGKLGLRPRTIQIIHNYISKGGSFTKPEDLGKIYGLQEEEFKILLPFIRISQNTVAEGEERKIKLPSEQREYAYERAENRLAVIDINTADTTAWIRLPGIGPKLASRVVQFRTKLGGFHSVEQIAETYGLPDSTYQKIRPWLIAPDPKPALININTATLDDLKQHPYIRWHLANAIIAYRGQHGSFRSIEELENIAIIDSVKLSILRPYLVVD